MNKEFTRGYTLIEIMIVVAIIGILSALAIPNFIKYRKDSQRTACINNMKIIDAAIEQAVLDGMKKVQITSVATLCGSKNYIKVEPKCPVGNSTYGINMASTDGNVVTCSKATSLGHKLN